MDAIKRILLTASCIAIFSSSGLAQSYDPFAPWGPSPGGGGGGSGTITSPALGTYTGSVGIVGNRADGTDLIGNANGASDDLNTSAYGAIASSINPAAGTAAIVNGSPNVALSAAGTFTNKRGIVIYNAGAACSINSTDCSSITVAAPTATVQGYAGANGGTTTAYSMKVAACDANGGCTAVSTISSDYAAATILSQPHMAGVSGNNVTWTVGAVAGADHYVWWRSINSGATYLLWRRTNTNSFTDWSNHSTMSTTKGRWNSTPLAAATKDDFVSKVSSGGGTTSLILTDNAVSTGSFTAWPDDTASFQAMIDVSNTTGQRIRCLAGYYKVRTLIAKPKMLIEGPFRNVNGLAGCFINGTTGDNIFRWDTNGSPYGFRDLTFNGGNTTFYFPAGVSSVTFVSMNNIFTQSEYSGIDNNIPLEEWFVDGFYTSGGWYGFTMNGSGAYHQKSSFKNIYVNSPIVDCLRWNTTVQVTEAIKFDRFVCHFGDQDGIWMTAPTVRDVTFDGLTTEGNGRDFLTPNTTTAQCTSGSGDYVVTSATGLAIGQDYTVEGCQATQLPIEGTICAIAGTTISLADATCTTPVLAGRTPSAPTPSTNGIYDDIYSTGQFTIRDGIIGHANRWAVRSSATFIENSVCGTLGILDTNASDSVINTQCKWVTPILGTVGITAGQDATGSIANAAGYARAMHTSPQGGDYNIGCVDSANNGTGTWGSIKFLNNKTNTTTLSTFDCTLGNMRTKGGVGSVPAALSVFGACDSTAEGVSGTQTNSTAACSSGVAATSAGSTHCQIYCNGTNWVQTGR